MRVGIVDREVDVRQLLRRYLILLGHEVIELRNEEELFKLLSKEPKDLPEVILFDVLLQNPQGWEIVQRLKSHPAFRYIHLVLMTTNISKKYVELAQNLGVNDIVAKPFEWNILEERLTARA